MSFGSIIFTNLGLALQQKAELGAALSFTKIGLGDGELGSQTIPELTALIHEVKTLDINKLKMLTNGTVAIGGMLSNQNISTGFYWRELALFATDPDVGEILYCYGNAGALAEYIPAGGTEIVEKQIDVLAIIGNAANVSAVINESLVWETPAGAQEKVDNHAALTAVHGATPAATPSRIIIRDQNGRAKIVAPAADDDIANKAYVDAVQASLTLLSADIAQYKRNIEIRKLMGGL